MRALRNAQIVLFLLAFAWALIQLPLRLAAPGFGQPFELTTVASNLAANGQFRDPFGIPTGPTAHVAPVYTAIFAVAIKMLREPVNVILAMMVLNAFFYGCAAALLPVLSRCVYGRIAPGAAGGVLLAASGWMMPQWEAALSSLLLLVATLAILRRKTVQAGLWSGICLLTNPASLLALAPIVLSSSREGRPIKAWRFVIPVAGLALIICAPWVVRNGIALGTPFFIRDNLGLELYISNQDRSSPEFVTNWPLFHLHPNQNPEEAKLVAAMGEGRYNQMRLRDAFHWIRSHRRKFLQLSAARVLYYWFPSRVEGWPAYLYWVMSGFGAWGVWVSRKNHLALSLALAAVIYSATFTVISTHLRYRFPTLWISALFAGCAMIEIVERIRNTAHSAK
jgi:hypothetical protein